MWIWIDSLSGWIVVIVNHLSVWIWSGLRVKMKGGRLSVRMKNNRLNHGTNNDWTNDWTNDGTNGWTNNDGTNDGTNGWTNDGTNGWTNNYRGLIVTSEFVF